MRVWDRRTKEGGADEGARKAISKSSFVVLDYKKWMIYMMVSVI